MVFGKERMSSTPSRIQRDGYRFAEFEGYVTTESQKKLIRRYRSGRLSKEQFLDQAYKQAVDG